MTADAQSIEGRRIPDGEWFEINGSRECGDYCLMNGYTGAHKAVFFIKPNGKESYITDKHHNIVKEPDGSLSITPDIVGNDVWRGVLDAGFWRRSAE